MRNEQIVKAFRDEEKLRRLWNNSMTRHIHGVSSTGASFINQVVAHNRAMIAEVEADDKLYRLLGY